MTDTLKALFKELQNKIKLEPAPFKRIARHIGLSENEVLNLIKENIENKIIRRIGAAVRPDKLDYKSNALIAWKVDPKQIQTVGRKLAEKDYITHCYERECPKDWPYNLFTMICAKTGAELDEIIQEISKNHQLGEYKIFKTVKELKKSSMIYFE